MCLLFLLPPPLQSSGDWTWHCTASGWNRWGAEGSTSNASQGRLHFRRESCKHLFHVHVVVVVTKFRGLLDPVTQWHLCLTRLTQECANHSESPQALTTNKTGSITVVKWQMPPGLSDLGLFCSFGVSEWSPRLQHLRRVLKGEERETEEQDDSMASRVEAWGRRQGAFYIELSCEICFWIFSL